MNAEYWCAFLGVARASERVAATARAALMQFNNGVECPRYFAALTKALKEDPPPFGKERYSDIYRGASENGEWMAISLMTNAEREGDGAKRLWSLAACSVDNQERQLIKRHAVDESSHALAYLALLDRAFPGAVSASFRSELKQLSPSYSMGQKPAPVEGSPYARTPSVDDFVQMNIAEIRTTIHHLMQRSALARHCPARNLPQLTKILDSLLLDELRHVAYTAVLIEETTKGEEAKELQPLFIKRVYDFNRITDEELGQSQLIFD